MDIVERIGAWEPTPEDCEEAATEIARLRADNERQYAIIVDAYGQLFHAANMGNAVKILQSYLNERRAALAADDNREGEG